MSWLDALLAGITVVQSAGSALPQQPILNFSSAFAVTADAANTRNTVSLASPVPSPTLSNPTITGETTYQGPSFSTTYSNQYEVATTDATLTTIATIPIPSTCTFRLDFEVGAYSSSAGNPAATWKCAISYVSVSGVITALKAALLISDSDGTNSDAPPSGWAPSVAVSGSNLLIKVTGAASTNINWSVLAQWRVTT